MNRIIIYTLEKKTYNMKHLKNYNNFQINEGNNDMSNIKKYIEQVHNNTYLDLTDDLFNDISEEGWLDNLEEFYDKSFNKSNFRYTTLNLDDADRQGLIDFDDDVIEKFNDFDIELKELSDYPFILIDFIDYDKGIVYIINFKESQVNEAYMNKPSGLTADLMYKYGVDIMPSGFIYKDGKKIGKIEKHMIPSGKFYVKDAGKRHIKLEDSYEDALKSILDNL